MGKFTGSIILTSAGGNYDIELSREKVYKFAQAGDGMDLSPDNLDIKCFSLKNGQKTVLESNSYTIKLYLIGDEYELVENVLSKLQVEGTILSDLVLQRDSSNSWTLGVETLATSDAELRTGTSQTVKDHYEDIKDALIKENSFLLIEAHEYQTDKFLASKALPIEFGTSENMANFAITATSIQAAVNSSLLTFDETYGLTIQNGGIRILSGDPSNPELVFGYDENDDTLIVKGDGEFSGNLSAFSGTIGGFRITDNALFSTGGLTDPDFAVGIATVGETQATPGEGASIKLDGASGEIYARTLTLGIGAKIENYLKLGEYTKILNPEVNDGKVFTIEAPFTTKSFISLNQNAELQIGQLLLNGQQSEIIGRSSETNHYFSITPELAEFTNANIAGKISAAIFEINKIQTVGGAMLFKPAYKVASQQSASSNASSVILTLEENFGTESPISATNSDYVFLMTASKENSSALIQQDRYLGIVSAIDSTDNKKITVKVSDSSFSSNVKIENVIYLGKKGSIIIGVNSQDKTAAGLLYGQGLTISEFEPNDTTGNVLSAKVRTFLGNLSGTIHNNTTLADQKISGFGLYGENVFLTGSLTTKTGSSFAGVNTISGAQFQQTDNDNSNIVFWAGANSTEPSSIQNAPFQVTQNGTVYATQGVFRGTISASKIVGSEIHSTDIYTSKIHGDNSSVPGLAFYEQAKGIAFYRGAASSNPTEIFSISNTGFTYNNNKNFINLDSGLVGFEGDYFFTSIVENRRVKVQESEIIFEKLYSDGTSLAATNAKIAFNGKNLSLGYGVVGQPTPAPIVGQAQAGYAILPVTAYGTGILIGNSDINLLGQTTVIQDILTLKNKIQYRPFIENDVVLGYDLYVL